VFWRVWQRSGSCCEYCHLPASIYPLPFNVDRIIARQHGGATIIDNLALACLHWNPHKGPNIAAHDATVDELVRLFHPRQAKGQLSGFAAFGSGGAAGHDAEGARAGRTVAHITSASITELYVRKVEQAGVVRF